MVTLVTLATCSPWIVQSAVEILSLDSTTPIEWLPESFPPRQAYGLFCREFESGDVVVASWPECTLGSPAIDRFIAAATGPNAPRNAGGKLWFESAVAGTTALERLTSPP